MVMGFLDSRRRDPLDCVLRRVRKAISSLVWVASFRWNPLIHRSDVLFYLEDDEAYGDS